jgi:hypothetical protein
MLATGHKFVRISNGLAAILFLPFENRTGHFLTSLDDKGHKKYFIHAKTV